ncbi:AHH domain-containing protein [Aliikangiella sp. IMCC44359]|uniref:AHH domain-containing protein n=1 Tax=Aliikangiella sp. IMCC44359 TaxID=3459125 RepID=UPI00403A93C2
MVSGSHPEAESARQILAKFQIRIDDPDNGVYLPQDSRFIPHEDMPDASNHAKVHTKLYYINITNILSSSRSKQDCRVALKMVAKKLKSGTLEY